MMRAEAVKGFVCVYVIGVVINGKDEIRIGTAASPVDIFKTAQQWNSREVIVHAVIWTPAKLFADMLKKDVEAELESYCIRGSWYHLDPETIKNVVLTSARRLKIEIFNDYKRFQIYEDDVNAAIAKNGLLQKARAAANALPSAKVLTFNKPRR